MKCRHERKRAFSTRWASGVNCLDCGKRLETHRDQAEIDKATDGVTRKARSKGNLERAEERDATRDRIDDPATWAKATEQDKKDVELDESDIAF